jgi:GINS complex subunit 2
MSVVNSASDDIQNSDKVRSLLKDIREARQAKSRDGLQKIDHSELSVRSCTRWLVFRAHGGH